MQSNRPRHSTGCPIISVSLFRCTAPTLGTLAERPRSTDRSKREENTCPRYWVTGAGRGIGLAITRHMSARGWDVYATARSDSALSELGAMPRVHPTRLDITDRESLKGLAAQLPEKLDGVVNNAGIVVNGPVEGLTSTICPGSWTSTSSLRSG